ncbi:hypothetical protein MIMGU_mgv11b019430mg [Erythranthe guttata]|uniref:NB-ARC domain-containing protein n=1 Tax=Erythranthe guttata TaxID=4155 RepID=A0A022RSP7_ERYGU|nr:hypothetical protein MIMGU_mgv11b019430mg [Erythranthe guttata]
MARFKNSMIRLKIGRRMDHITQKIGEVDAERKMFGFQEMAIERPIDADTSTILLSHLWRERRYENIVDILVKRFKDNQEISVLPIISVGGQGKTTLAQLVYNDQRVAENLDKRIWVCVSDNFDVKTLLKVMIKSTAESASN